MRPTNTTTLSADKFKQTNLVGIISRANDILIMVEELNMPKAAREDLINAMLQVNLENQDHWEHLAWMMVKMEMFERDVREEDPSIPSHMDGWAGGLLG